jgi:hypothetical protein
MVATTPINGTAEATQFTRRWHVHVDAPAADRQAQTEFDFCFDFPNRFQMPDFKNKKCCLLSL